MIFNFTPLNKHETWELGDGDLILYKSDTGEIFMGRLEIRVNTRGEINYFFHHLGIPHKNIWSIGHWPYYSKMTKEDQFLFKLESE